MLKLAICLAVLVTVLFAADDCETSKNAIKTCMESAAVDCEKIVCSNSGSNTNGGKNGDQKGPQGGPPGGINMTETQKETMRSCLETACPKTDSETHKKLNGTFCFEKMECFTKAMKTCHNKTSISTECKAKMEAERVTECECFKTHAATCASKAGVTLPANLTNVNCSAPMGENCGESGPGIAGQKPAPSGPMGHPAGNPPPNRAMRMTGAGGKPSDNKEGQSETHPTGSPPTGNPPSGSHPTGNPSSGSSPTGSPPTGNPPTRSHPTGNPPSGSPPSGSPPTGNPPHGGPPGHPSSSSSKQ